MVRCSDQGNNLTFNGNGQRALEHNEYGLLNGKIKSSNLKEHYFYNISFSMKFDNVNKVTF